MSKHGKNRLTRHHVIPSSRGGSNEPNNILLKSDREHRAYHLLFGNRTPDEIIEWITSGHFQITTDVQWRAWRLLFDHFGPQEAAAVIRDEWTKYGG